MASFVLDSDYLRKLLLSKMPNPKVGKAGEEVTLNCLFHAGDEGRNLSVNVKKGVFQCWVCGEKGGIIKFLDQAVKEGLITLAERIRAAAPKDSLQEIGMRLKARLEEEEGVSGSSAEEGEGEGLFSIWPEDVVPLVREMKSPRDIHQRALAYLFERGMSIDDVQRYKLRVGTGIGTRYFGRVFFPVFTPDGEKVVHWVARTIFPDVKPKVLNSSKPFTTVTTSMCLFGIERVKTDFPVAICEGVFDVFSVEKVTGMPAVALLGKKLHPKHVVLLWEKKPSAVYVCLDGGELQDASAIANRLRPMFPISIVNLPIGEDPNSVPREILYEVFMESELS